MKLIFTNLLVLMTLIPAANGIRAHKQSNNKALCPVGSKLQVEARNAPFVSAQAGMLTYVFTQGATETAAINGALRTSFGSVVEAVTAFQPFYVTGDFNGDVARDLAVAVQIKGSRATLPKDVRVLSPWGAAYGNASYPSDPAGKPTLALVIIHGSKAGWQNQPSQKFLLVGDSPILILNYSRLTGGPDALRELISLVRLGKIGRGEYLPPTVKRARKGDVIVLGTEAVDSYLYWNGKTYSWEESPED